MDAKELMKLAFRYQNALIGYAYGLSRDWLLAEDAVQEAFMVLIDKADEYKPELGVYGWLKKMVYYTVQSNLRKRNRTVLLDDAELAELVERALTEHFAEDGEVYHERQGALMQCVQMLQDRARDLITQFYWNDRSAEELACALGMSREAVWTQLCRIRKRLRKCVELRLAAEGNAQ